MCSYSVWGYTRTMNDTSYKPRNMANDSSLKKTKKIQRYIAMAKNKAKQSTYGKIKHGAVLVKGGSVISSSFNKDKFSAFGNRFRRPENGPATHHAELGCIFGVDKSKTSGATLYVVRINKHDEFRLSKPCPMCHEILKFCGIRKVVYTANEKDLRCYKI